MRRSKDPINKALWWLISKALAEIRISIKGFVRNCVVPCTWIMWPLQISILFWVIVHIFLVEEIIFRLSFISKLNFLFEAIVIWGELKIKVCAFDFIRRIRFLFELTFSPHRWVIFLWAALTRLHDKRTMILFELVKEVFAKLYLKFSLIVKAFPMRQLGVRIEILASVIEV